MASRAADVIAAGSDVALHCNGDLDEMELVAGAVPELGGTARERFDACLRISGQTTPFDLSEAEAALAALTSHVA